MGNCCNLGAYQERSSTKSKKADPPHVGGLHELAQPLDGAPPGLPVYPPSGLLVCVELGQSGLDMLTEDFAYDLVLILNRNLGDIPLLPPLPPGRLLLHSLEVPLASLELIPNNIIDLEPHILIQRELGVAQDLVE